MSRTLKISAVEAICLICLAMVNQIIINIPKMIITQTGSSAWINVLYISVIAVFIVLIISKLFSNFYGKDIVDISQYLGGKVLKTVIGLLYISMFVLSAATSLKYFCDKLKLIYFHETPIYLLIFSFIISAVIVNRIGGNAVIKVNCSIVAAFLISMIVLIFVTSKSFVTHRLFPILGYGTNETFFTGITNLFAFEGFAYLYFIMPILKNSKDFKKVSVISCIISGICLFLSVISLTLVFSYITKTDDVLLLYFLTRIASFGN